MKKNPLTKGVLTIKDTGIGTVTQEMIHARARELALLAGHSTQHVRQSDYEQAMRELTGESDIDHQNAVLEALPETKRWDPVPGSPGRQAQESSSEDEDEEGRSETEQLVDAGAEEAERDRMFQAAQDAAKKDTRES